MADVVRFGPYDLLRPVGEGGMAQVYLARPRRLPDTPANRVVIKVVRQELLTNPTIVGMFLEEGRLLARLQHPHIVRIVDVDMLDDIPFMVIEYVHGPTLFQVRRHVGRPSERDLGRMTMIVAQACRGLHAAHTVPLDDGMQGVVHRDVSLQNILVAAPTGQTKLIDFGIAKAPDSTWDTKEGLLRGKVAYLAPELLGGASASAASDVFAVGVIVFWLVHGRMPHAPSTPIEQRGQPIDADLPGTPDDLAEVLRQATDPHPDARPTAAELADALTEAAAQREAHPDDVRPFVATVFPRGEEDWMHLVRPVAEHGTLARLTAADAQAQGLKRLATVAIVAAALASLTLVATALWWLTTVV